jgi:hypothetical protein
MIALAEYKPDVVFCFAIRPTFGSYYQAIKNTGAKLVLWYPDMTERTRDYMWRTKLANVADVLIFSIKETAQRYKHLAPTVLWMPQYFDHRFCSSPRGNLPARLDPTKPIYDVCFIGSCDGIRNEWLDKLRDRYNCTFSRDAIRRGREVRGYRMAQMYAQSKIAINIQRTAFTNCGSYVVSNRIYNAMGSGAFFLNHPVTDLGLVFKEGDDLVSHDNTFEDMCAKIDFYLREDRLREYIARSGQRQVLIYHTLEQRVKEYWKVLRAIRDNTGEIETGAFGCWVKS